MRLFKVMGAVIATALTAGCASRSSEVTASYVSPIEYQNYTCLQLAQESARISRRAAEVSGAQDSKATGDAVATTVAVIVFWPALFAVRGDGATAAELANLKGRADAIQSAAITKNCTVQTRS